MAEQNKIEKILSDIYYTAENPASFSNLDKIYKEAKKKDANITRGNVLDWLKSQFVYTLHRRAEYNFKRNKILVSHIDQQWQADLVDLQKFSDKNDNFKYLITIIDCFSKYAFVRPLKTKGASHVAKAFEDVFKIRFPQYIQTDQGTEFSNAEVQELFNKYGIKHFYSTNQKIKCAIVERFNRTLKEKMWKFFTANGSYRYIDKLQDLVKSYNSSYHRSIKMSPENVTKEAEQEVFFNLYNANDVLSYFMKNSEKNKIELRKGATVRKQHQVKSFEKGYYPKWTDALYTVKNVSKGQEKPIYTLLDQNKQKVKGRFYGKEIQPVKEGLYRVEKIIKTRVRNGRREWFVKWLGYPDKFNSWTSDKPTPIQHGTTRT